LPRNTSTIVRNSEEILIVRVILTDTNFNVFLTDIFQNATSQKHLQYVSPNVFTSLEFLVGSDCLPKVLMRVV